MNIVVGGHGSGRSAELLRKADEEKAIFCTGNPARAMAEAYILKYRHVRIMSYRKALEEAGTAGKIYIDDLETFVRAVTNCELAGFSLLHSAEKPVLVRDMNRKDKEGKEG